MRSLLFASAAVLALGGTAFAQNATGNPHSAAASNITGGDTHSNLAPQLPSPGVDMSPEQLLQRASQDVRAGRTGAAQEALEEAETRLLDRSTAPAMASSPVSGPRVDAIHRALDALARGDRSGAQQGIQMAMQHPAMQGNGMSGNMSSDNGTMGDTMPASVPAATAPMPASAAPMPNGMNNNPAGLSGGSGNAAAQ